MYSGSMSAASASECSRHLPDRPIRTAPTCRSRTARVHVIEGVPRFLGAPEVAFVAGEFQEGEGGLVLPAAHFGAEGVVVVDADDAVRAVGDAAGGAEVVEVVVIGDAVVDVPGSIWRVASSSPSRQM